MPKRNRDDDNSSRKMLNGASLFALAGVLALASACASEPGTAALTAGPEDAVETVETVELVKRDVIIEKADDGGESRKVRKVIVLEGDETMDFEMFADSDVEIHAPENGHKTVKVIRAHKGPHHFAECEGEEGEESSAKFEWKDESEDGSIVNVSVICLTGDDASPEHRIAALEKAIAHFELENARAMEHRAKVLADMKAKLDQLKADAE